VRALISAVAAVLVAASPLAATQSPPAGGSAPAAVNAVTVVGCVSASPDGKGFVLTRQADAPGTTTSPGPAPGTSTTGDAPGGTVTPDTPTGATATETAVPTPPVGEPGTQVNPTSPTYNQGEARTSGTVGRADTASAAFASVSYRLKATHGVDLASHVGHTVEVRGTLTRDPRATGSGDSTTPATAGSRLMTVEALKHRAASCTR
jgi:hypothetical protein